MKFLNSLDILGSGGTLLDVQGSQGQLFSVTDSLSGSIFAVSDISGVPILDVNSSGTSYFSGDVGIGTTAVTSPGFWYDATNKYLAISHWATPPTPVALLHLSDNANNLNVPQIRIEGRENPGDTKLDISVKDPDVRFNLIENTPDANVGYGLMIFKTNAVANSTHPNRGGFNFQTPAATSSLFITNEANVGIGTTSPGRTLDVRGDAQILATASTGLRIVGGNTSEVYMIFGDADDHSMGGFAYNNNTNELSVDVNNSEAIRINSSGNVGIGITTPQALLHISGTVNTDDTKLYLTENNNLLGGYLKYDGDANINYLGGLDTTERPVIAYPRDGSTVTLLTGSSAALYIDSLRTVKFNEYSGTNKTGTPTYLLGTDAAGNIVKTNTIPGSAAGPYLPLAGGTLTGALTLNGEIYGRTSAAFPGLGGLGFYSLVPYLQNANQGGLKIQVQQGNSLVDALTLDFSKNATFAGIVGIGAAPTTEANLSLGAKSVSEGGHLILNKGTSYTLATHLDNYASSFRVMSGTDTSSSAVQFSINHSTAAAAFTGTVTAPTFIGDLNGTINTVTTAVTKANATNDTTVATTAFVQNLIGTIPAGLVFQGTWNAATNTPTLTSGSGTTGHFYIVSTSGSTNLDGVTDWVTGDWAVFIEQGGTDAWEKIDNSSVLDGAGTGQTLPLWSGSGTSNTLTDSNITQDANLITKFGKTAVTTTAVASINHASNDFLYINGGTGGASIGDDDQNTRAIFYNNDYIRFDAAGAERMRIESDGIISIGEGATQSWIANKVQTTTTAVSGKQNMSDIDRTTANWMRITNPVYSTNGSVGLIMRTFPNSDARQGAGIIASGGSDNAATDLDLFVSRQTSGATTSTSYSALSIKGNTGKVGIGTTSPDYLLDLYRSTGTTGSTTGTTLQRLWNYVGSDLQQQKTFVDFVFQDDNDNEYPQVRIGAEVGQNGNADTQEKEGSGAFVVYTNNATGVVPSVPVPANATSHALL